jgi:regulator of sigma D
MTDIISTLIKQHRTLQTEVSSVIDCYQLEKVIAAEKISSGLKKFTQELAGHLKLENEVFYVELLDKMKRAGQDISKTELFIAEMKDIEKVVYAFLSKFKDTASIETSFENFQKEFDAIKQVLVMRIESEEEGVYGYWNLY